MLKVVQITGVIKYWLCRCSWCILIAWSNAFYQSHNGHGWDRNKVVSCQGTGVGRPCYLLLLVTVDWGKGVFSSAWSSPSLLDTPVFRPIRRSNVVLRWANNTCLCPDGTFCLCVVWPGSISPHSSSSSHVSFVACGKRIGVALDSEITQSPGLTVGPRPKWVCSGPLHLWIKEWILHCNGLTV